jgi:hypothetical protein
MNEMSKRLLRLGPLVLSILVLASTSNTVFSQNLTTSASNATGNATSTVNQTVPEASNQSNANQSSGVNQSVGAVGSAQELSQVLGNNSQMLENKTPIGSTPTLGNATESSANITLGKLGQNTSETTSGLLNKTEEVAKKVIGGAADVVTNITGEIKKGVGAK